MPSDPSYEELQQQLKEVKEENKYLLQKLALSGTEFGDGSTNINEEVIDLGSLINVKKLQSILDDFHNLTGMVTAILDMKGTVIESTGWQDICTKFHRVNPETARHCTESDLFLVDNIKPGEYIEYRCKNGLWDVVTPLYLRDIHLGNIYTGQFFYEDDQVSEEKFLQQAEKYGFEKDDYMAAFRKIPRYRRDEIKHLMGFLVKFASYVSNLSYTKVLMEKEIFDRKEAEKALEDQKKRQDYILEAVHSGTWEWNVQTGETIFNFRWAEIVGYSIDELSPVSINTWESLCHPDDIEESERLLNLCFEKKSEYYECEWRMKHKDGHWVWILDRGRVMTWTDEGKPEWMFGTHQDISERKQAELEKRKLENKLVQAQKMESIGRLAGGVAHDFNNMLGVIIGHSDLMLNQLEAGPDTSLRYHLKEIKNAADHSALLTRQLLAFARKEEVFPKVLDLNEIIVSILSMLQRIIGENIDLRWLPGDSLPYVKVDSGQFNQVLTNLCINARDAIDKSGTVTIETSSAFLDEDYCREHPGFLPGHYVVLAVSDDGCGMDKDTLSHIFEPFYTTKELGKGTGLGLATIYGVVKQNNAFINVYSEPGEGSTFRIFLPGQEGEEAFKPVIPISINSRAKYNETVLLVEDEPAILDLTEIMLVQEGYTVLRAGNPEDAIKIVKEQHNVIDLLITDVVMPIMTGQDLVDTIHNFYPELKILYMSGYTANVIANQGILEEGIPFIQKPFTKADLSAKVRQILDNK